MLLLPLASVAVLVTVVTPTGKVLPLGGVLTRLVTLQLSVALTLKVTLLRLQQIGRASCRERVEISVVAVSLKKKKTVNLQVLWLPMASVAVFGTVVVPMWKG